MLRESETAVPSCRKSRNEGRGKTELLQSAETPAEIQGAPGRIRTWVRKPLTCRKTDRGKRDTENWCRRPRIQKKDNGKPKWGNSPTDIRRQPLRGWQETWAWTAGALTLTPRVLPGAPPPPFLAPWIPICPERVSFRKTLYRPPLSASHWGAKRENRHAYFLPRAKPQTLDKP